MPQPTAPLVIGDMPSKICKVLNALAPQAPKLGEVGTHVQLVLSLADAFDTDAAALRQVQAEIDAVAIASCPSSRETLLTALKMPTLYEALR